MQDAKENEPGPKRKARSVQLKPGYLSHLRGRTGLSCEDLAAQASLSERTVRRAEKGIALIDRSTLNRLAQALNCSPLSICTHGNSSMHAGDPVGRAFRRWIVLDSRDELSLEAESDVLEKLRLSKDPIFRNLRGDESEATAFLLMTRDYLKLDADGKYRIVDRKPPHVMEERIYVRTCHEAACVRWLFDPDRRKREQPTILKNMRQSVIKLRDQLRVIRDRRTSARQVIDALHDFYFIEQQPHIEKMGPHEEFRRDLERLLASCVRVRHDLLNAEEEYSELRGKPVDRGVFLRDAQEMFCEHVRFIRLARGGATVDELCCHDESHVTKVSGCLERLQKVRTKIIRLRGH